MLPKKRRYGCEEGDEASMAVKKNEVILPEQLIYEIMVQDFQLRTEVRMLDKEQIENGEEKKIFYFFLGYM